ncbi:MAG TPA: hypothetical protein VEN81_05555, partial [Planctomycetota bacterium]|nr:hypothetical protein [Planctomycetota bacterium]
HLAASGQVAVDGALTYGYVTLYQDPKGDHDYYFISPANTLWGLTPISGAAADDLSNDLFGNPYWVQFGNDPHTTTQGARLIWAGAAWSTN